MVSLRNEIMEAQKTRSDLMKWKVVLVSSLGAVGLGITEIHTVDKIKFVPGLVLCLIPFVCVYVDSLCRHLMCKILVIGRFLATHDPKDTELLCKYEKFTEKAMSVFGSGWAFLLVDKNKKLELKRQSFQNSPLMFGNTPIIGIDVWEHAYYLKYQNKRDEYIKAWWNVLDWKQAEENLQKTLYS